MRTWTGSWRWIMLVLLAWGTLLFYIGGHLVRDSEQPEHPSRELSKILAKLERLKHQNEELRRMAETLRSVSAFSLLLCVFPFLRVFVKVTLSLLAQLPHLNTDKMFLYILPAIIINLISLFL